MIWGWKSDFFICRNFIIAVQLCGQNLFLGLKYFSRMSTGLRVEDRLDGAANYCSWKTRIVLVLKKNELWDVVHNTVANPVQIPTAADVAALTAFNKKDTKAQRIILDAVKDHVIPIIREKIRAYEMFDALIKTFQSSNENRKMVLKEKLKCIRMAKGECLTSYLT